MRNLTSSTPCSVYSEDDPFTSYVQAFLAAAALGSLFYKRSLESPRRPLRTWSLDVSKLGLGAVYAHLCNMAVAKGLGTFAGTGLQDECAWYAMNYFVDTSFGLLLSLLLVSVLRSVASSKPYPRLRDQGVYPEGREGWLTFRDQTFAWLCILTLVKAVLCGFLWLFAPFFAVVGEVAFRPFQGHNQAELVFVMIVLPGVLNVMYFWVADSYMKG
eukprot:CAMPEP_0182453394 /NCGR_PEP_ID=MMETSP1319-20130603/478_1 /TAXON_ID=172717 /ORGANISM="Bolidomonas pacifica, Strain RCC208" /LENGTH=214 /DNA_ID=CAMNT_0024651325 /DNA_START=230 /DNA_END=870 /DNA_ORIENTATION=-